MARIRQIKPDFFRHEELYELEKHWNSTRQEQGQTGYVNVRVAFSGLWTVCDRDGRFRWRPNQLKLDILPFDPIDFEEALSALESKQFVISYIVYGEKYGYIPSWKKHQQPHVKEKPSTIPEPGSHESSPGSASVLSHSRTPDSGLRNTEYGIPKSGAKPGNTRKQEAPSPKTQLDSQEWTPDSLCQVVATELRITDRWVKVSLSQQLGFLLGDGEDPQKAAERIIAAGRIYGKGEQFKFGGWKKFVEDRLWESVKQAPPRKSAAEIARAQLEDGYVEPVPAGVKL